MLEPLERGALHTNQMREENHPSPLASSVNWLELPNEILNKVGTGGGLTGPIDEAGAQISFKRLATRPWAYLMRFD